MREGGRLRPAAGEQSPTELGRWAWASPRGQEQEGAAEDLAPTPPRTPGPCLIPGPQLEWDPPRTGAPLYPSPGTDPAPAGAPFPSKTCRASWTGPHSYPKGLGCQGGCPLLLGAFSLPSARELRTLRQPSCRDLTLGLWADRGSLGGALHHLPRAGRLPNPGLHSQCPSCCLQVLKSSQQLLCVAGSGSRQEGQAHRMSGVQEGSPEDLRDHLLSGWKVGPERGKGCAGSLWSTVFLRPGTTVPTPEDRVSSPLGAPPMPGPSRASAATRRHQMPLASWVARCS